MEEQNTEKKGNGVFGLGVRAVKGINALTGKGVVPKTGTALAVYGAVTGDLVPLVGGLAVRFLPSIMHYAEGVGVLRKVIKEANAEATAKLEAEKAQG